MKGKFRKQILDKRKLISKDNLLNRSCRLEKNLFAFKPFINSKNVMCFVSFGKEPNTHSIIEKSLESKTVIVPKIFGDNLLPCKISSVNDFAKGPYGVLEPIGEDPFPVSKIDFVLVPGLAFTEKGQVFELQ